MAAGYFAHGTPSDPRAAANEAAVSGQPPAAPFPDRHQAGILRPPPRATAVVSLDVTFGVGSTLFDDRYGLAAARPLRLTPMRSFQWSSGPV